MQALPEADNGIVGADAPGVTYPGELLVVVVLVVVVVAVVGVVVSVVVGVVDGVVAFVVVEGVVPPDPAEEGVVVVVVVLQPPRRWAKSPHVEVVASICSNAAFCAAMVDGRGGAGDPATTTVRVMLMAKRTMGRVPIGRRPIRPAFSERVRRCACPRRRASAISRCGRRGNWVSLRGRAITTPIGWMANPFCGEKPVEICG